MSKKPNAVVLLSGGLDSTTTVAIAKSEGFSVHALTFRYGQRHEAELTASRQVAQAMGVQKHVEAEIDLRLFGGSALTTTDIEVPKDRPIDQLSEGIPVTYVPARNTIFLSFALAWSEVLEAQDIFIGVNALDYSGYPDCRPEYVDAFRRLARLATRRAVEGQPPEIVAPLQYMGKADIIRKGAELSVDFSLTLSCYNPDGQGRACGRCDACALRRGGFVEAGVPDPTIYRPGVTFADQGARLPGGSAI